LKKNTLKDLTITSGQFVKEGMGDLYSNYELCNYIGKGGFGRVYKVRHKLSNQYRAMKIIQCKSLSDNISSTINKEINILKNLDHPNIIKVYEFFQSEKYVYIINELCTGGELFDKIVDVKFFSENVASNIMRQLLSAVAYCHENGVIHRDLKPENILIENSEEKDKDFFHIKVIDFGTCEIFKKKKLTEQIGTSFYIAPEVIKNSYNEKCDLWSCGVILYILLCGSPPFYGKNEKEIFKKIIEGNFTFRHKIWNKISNEAKNLVLKLLQVNPNKRLSAKEALEDIWFKKNINMNSLENNKKSSNYRLF
jgi:calcium-dependent protein kinase